MNGGMTPKNRPITILPNEQIRGWAHVAQLVEHVLGKDEVTRSIRVVGSRLSRGVMISGEVMSKPRNHYPALITRHSITQSRFRRTYGEGEI